MFDELQAIPHSRSVGDLSAETWKALGRHFASRRIPVPTGLRGWIGERMEKEGLR